MESLIQGSLILSFSLILPLFVPFVDFAVFPLLDGPLELFLAFGLLAVFHCVLDSKFKFCAFCYQWTHQGRD
jgi:hypothetical protein